MVDTTSTIVVLGLAGIAAWLYYDSQKKKHGTAVGDDVTTDDLLAQEAFLMNECIQGNSKACIEYRNSFNNYNRLPSDY